MEIKRRCKWELSIAEAIELQKRLAGEVCRKGDVVAPQFVAGADISVEKGGMVTAAAVVLSYPVLEIVEVKTVRGKAEFPYVPGLLSFREAPLTLEAFERLCITPDLVLVDAHGIAHPRRLGFAAHLGLCLGKPTIGCAKSRLCGEHSEPGQGAGSHEMLTDKDEIIGAAVRTRRGGKPVYVSVGNLIGLNEAISWVLKCCRGYRLPEPTRLAHLAAGGKLLMKSGEERCLNSMTV